MTTGVGPRIICTSTRVNAHSDGYELWIRLQESSGMLYYGGVDREPSDSLKGARDGLCLLEESR